MLKSTQKGKNVDHCARYIGVGIKEEFGSGRSTPPITLWQAGEPGALSEGSPGDWHLHADPHGRRPGRGDRRRDAGDRAARAVRRPGALRADGHGPGRRPAPVRAVLGLSVEDARQIFYDRNVEGVPVANNLAMSMDQRDFGTHPAHRVAETAKDEQRARSSRSPGSARRGSVRLARPTRK